MSAPEIPYNAPSPRQDTTTSSRKLSACIKRRAQRLSENALILSCRFLSLNLFRRVFKDSRTVTFVLPNVCVKCCVFSGATEARTMEFVRRNTSIPVPKVYGTFERKGRTYMVMETAPGQPLAFDWGYRSGESQRKILDQLKAHIAELRVLSPPPDVGVTAVNNAPITDPRLPITNHHGPFASIEDFHLYLRNGIKVISNADDFPGIRDLFSFHDDRHHQVVFTHGDLSSFNIIAKGDKITGIIDWETSGWLPEYWEYTTAFNVNPQNEFWREEVEKFLEADEDAKWADEIRRMYFGDF